VEEEWNEGKAIATRRKVKRRSEMPFEEIAPSRSGLRNPCKAPLPAVGRGGLVRSGKLATARDADGALSSSGASAIAREPSRNLARRAGGRPVEKYRKDHCNAAALLLHFLLLRYFRDDLFLQNLSNIPLLTFLIERIELLGLVRISTEQVTHVET
jgi:hypothetical protein